MGKAGIGALRDPARLARPATWRIGTFGLPPALLVTPLLLFLGVFYAYPVASMMWRSVGEPHLTTAHYAALFSSDIYLLVFWITLRHIIEATG